MELGKYGICLLGIAVFGIIGYQAIEVIENNGKYIATNGLADRVVKSDSAKLTLSIVNETDSLKDVQTKRKSDKKIVIDFLLNCGFKSEEIKDGSINIEDQFRYFDKVEGKKKYKVTDYIVIETKNVDLTKKSLSEISSLIDKDVCVENSVKYFYKDIDKLRIEMIEDAAKDSKVRADHIAKTSGNKVIGLRNFSTGKFSIFSEDSSTTSENDCSDGENSVMKRIRVVVKGSYDIKG